MMEQEAAHYMSRDDRKSSVNFTPTSEHLSKDFFSGYRWCLNPILSLSDLMIRIEEEVQRLAALEISWQREESMINVYLFACAISCTLDDYLTRRRWHLAPIGNIYPKFRRLVGLVDELVNFPRTLHAYLRFGRLWSWKAEWDELVERACELLIYGGETGTDRLSDMRVMLGRLRSMTKAGDLLVQRMKLNEGFRCQDLTHHDIISMGKRYLSVGLDKQGEYVIIGARTAGSYIAPLLKVLFQRNRIDKTLWMTVRPKFGIHGHERRRLRGLVNANTNVVLVDDYSNTGGTFRMLEKAVTALGVPPSKITMLAPIHPAKGQGKLTLREEVKIITLDQQDLHINRLLDPESVEDLLRDLLSSEDVEDIRVLKDTSVDALNLKLWSHYPDSFQVRLKRIFQISIRRKDGSVQMERILGKSVGVGWLGYHAYLAGIELSEFVPRVIGLRKGILFMTWIDGQPLPGHDPSDQAIERMASYLACRTERLGLPEDPRSSPPFLSWGWLEILSVLRRAYGTLPGYLKHDVLLRALKRALHYSPTLVDARMHPSEWLSTNREIYKIDFEHHNFGAPELDVVDPAYDLAIACYEFHMTEEEEGRLRLGYSNKSGDKIDLLERVFLYKLLHGTSEGKKANLHLLSARSNKIRQQLNELSMWSWNFLVFTMNRFCSNLMRRPDNPHGQKGLFFMDIDGVLDTEVFGFPHTTISGLSGLALLRSGGYSVIPNTGRSCFNVKNYCSSYGLEGGIAEYGSAIVDSFGGREIPLVSSEVMSQLEICRKGLEGLKDVFVDPNYHYCLRVYRYDLNGTRGLGVHEVNDLVSDLGLDRLRVIARKADTYIVGRDADKGAAIELYKTHMGVGSRTTVAVGDSKEDVSMFMNVTRAYAPANCSASIRKFAKEKNWTIVSEKSQRGLLQVAEIETGVRRSASQTLNLNNIEKGSFNELMAKLLTIAEMPRYRRMLLLLDRKGLGIGFGHG